MLRKAGRPRGFRPRIDTLCFEGDLSSDVTIIMSGWAKVISNTDSGQQIVIAVRGPGEIVGEVSALYDRPRTATVVPLAKVETLAVSAVRFRAFLAENPAAWWSLTGTFVSRMEELSHRLHMQAEADSVRRLAILLRYLAALSDRYQRRGPADPIEILPRLSQTELGSWMNVSRETTARGFRELRSQGLVTTARKKTVVLDFDGLRAYAGGDGAR